VINSSPGPTTRNPIEQALKTRLVKMYLQDENVSVATPKHWSRSETELNWLKSGATDHLNSISRRSISPISLNQHIQFQLGRNHLLNDVLTDWVDQYVSNKKPLAYILGNVPFGDLTFTIRPPILIPRPETEQWVMQLSRTMKSYFQALLRTSSHHTTTDEPTLPHLSGPRPSRGSSFKVLDLGTGSGCISNYLAYHHQDVHAVGVDIDQDAVGLARENASSHKILCPNKAGPTSRHSRGRASFFNLDLFSPTFTQNLKQASQSLAGFDMIISNPPYIPLAEYHHLPGSVKHWESAIALVGDRNSGELDHHGPNRSISRSNQPSGDYGFFTSYRSASSPSLALGPTPSVGDERRRIGPEGRGETPGVRWSQDVEAAHHEEGRSPAGKDGLDFYRRIVQLIATGGLLKPDSSNFHHRSSVPDVQPLPKLVLEVGHGQAAAVRLLLLRSLPSVVSNVQVVKDFAGIDRCLLCY